MGQFTYFLGLHVQYNVDGSLLLHQSKYAKDLLKKAGMETCKPANQHQLHSNLTHRYLQMKEVYYLIWVTIGVLWELSNTLLLQGQILHTLSIYDLTHRCSLSLSEKNTQVCTRDHQLWVTLYKEARISSYYLFRLWLGSRYQL